VGTLPNDLKDRLRSEHLFTNGACHIFAREMLRLFPDIGFTLKRVDALLTNGELSARFWLLACFDRATDTARLPDTLLTRDFLLAATQAGLQQIATPGLRDGAFLQQISASVIASISRRIHAGIVHVCVAVAKWR
jgi:hypothetical protein